ncbi:DUF1778 domain-containing protein [Methylobacterium sp. WL18]|nr:DUF1778 domain-containing protein [Methylobacterium sp. WL7]TXN63418.1 DUF1778 domain-containing protein [Methylobacterium sp. WL18]
MFPCAQSDCWYILLRSVIEGHGVEVAAVTEAAEVLYLSEWDFARVLALLEDPPPPNDKLRAAIAALPDDL